MQSTSIIFRTFVAGVVFCAGAGVAQADDILKAKLEADGKLKVEVKGLVLNDESTGESNGTPDGVTDVVATVICGGKVAGAAKRVPLSNPKGEAKVEAKLAIPANCDKPVVLLREIWEGKIGGWLAGAGF